MSVSDNSMSDEAARADMLFLFLGQEVTHIWPKHNDTMDQLYGSFKELFFLVEGYKLAIIITRKCARMFF